MFTAGLWTVTRDGSTFLPEGSCTILCATWSKCLPTPTRGLLGVLNPTYHLLPYHKCQCVPRKELCKLLWGSIYGDSSCESSYQLKGLEEACWTKIYNLNNFKWSKDLVRWELPLQSFSRRRSLSAAELPLIRAVSAALAAAHCSLVITVHQLASKTDRFGGSHHENY